jgi:hypothetical protein
MAQTLKLKRSAVSGNAPSTGDLALGEIAINTYDGKIFIKKDDGTESIVTFEAGGSSNAGTIEEDSFSGNGSTTAFTLTTAPSSEENLLVFIDATFQNRDSFTISGTTITFDTAPDNGTSVRVYHVIPGTLDDGILTVAKFAADTLVTEAEGISSNDNDTTIPTSAAVKDYVDTQVATVDTLPEVLANGNTTGGTDISVSTGDDITFADSSKAIFGASSDLQIYHDGSHSFITDSGTGNLRLQGTNLALQNAAGTKNYFLGSDGGAATLYHNNTSVLSTTADGISVTSEVEADEFIGDLRGAVLFKAQAGENVTKGDVVYISGISGNTTVVSKADADDASKMPAFGIVATTTTSGQPVDIYTQGILGDLDTSAYSEGDELFVSTTAGALTNTPPTGETAAIQKIAKVTRSNNLSGSIFITGAGRTNAVPNLDQDQFFLGNASNQAVATDFSDAVEALSINNVVEDTTPQLGGDLASNGNDILFADDDKAIFGAGSDLQIYHDGSNSIVSDVGTGGLKLTGGDIYIRNPADQDMIYATSGGAVTLYHNNAAKLATTSTGIDVTGTATMDGLTVDGGVTVNSNTTTAITATQNANTDINGLMGIRINNSTGTTYAAFGNSGADSVVITAGDAGGTGNTSLTLKTATSGSEKSRLNISGTGDISFYDDTGSSQALFWDASAEALGLGTTSPSEKLEIAGYNQALAENTTLRFTDTDTSSQTNQLFGKIEFNSLDSDAASPNRAYILAAAENSLTPSYIAFGTAPHTSAATEAMRIDSSGNLLLGDTSTAGNAKFYLRNGSSGQSYSNVSGMLIDVNGTSNSYYGLRVGSSTGNSHLAVTNAGNVGIGTDSPSTKLMLEHNNDGAVGGTIRIKDRDSQQSANQLTGAIEFESEDATTPTSGVSTAIKAFAASSTGGSYLTISTTDISTSTLDERMRIDSSGGVIVNNGGSGNGIVKINGATGNTEAVIFQRGGTEASRIGHANSADLTFSTGSGVSERMRIDSSGNLLVGKTASSFTTDGIEARADGQLWVTDTSGSPLFLSRKTTDGAIATFCKEAATVGSIGIESTGFYIDGEAGHTGLTFISDGILPRDNGALTNGLTDVGSLNYRFRDLYLSGEVEATALDINGNGDISGNLTLGGYLAGPATFTIDPAAVGDNTGTVVIAGNLQVDGTTTTINSTTLTVDDKNITLASGSTNAAAANGAGLTVDCGSDTDTTFTFNGTSAQWNMNTELVIQPRHTGGTPPTLTLGDLNNQYQSGIASSGHLTMRAGGSGNLYWQNGGTYLMMMTNAGDLSIGNGTSAPTNHRVHIKTAVDNSVAQGLVIERSANTDRGYINYNGGGFQFRSTVGDPIVFGETDAEHMRILPDGNVGIGTSSPNHKLDVYSSERFPLRVHRTSSDLSNTQGVGIGLSLRGDTATSTSDTRAAIMSQYNGDFYIAVDSGGNLNTTDPIDEAALFIEGSNKYVGIGTTTPDSKLTVNTATTGDGIELQSSEVSIAKLSRHLVGSTVVASLDGVAGRPIHIGGAVNEKVILANAGGNVGIGSTAPAAKLQVEEYGIDTTETSTTATTQVAIHTMSATAFRSARFTVQVTNSTDSTYHLTEILMIHDGTTPSITEYGTIFTGSAEATFDADISSGNVRLLATPASTDTMEFKVVAHSITT